ncbi:MAG TPA: hypothetical protein ENJ32_09685 [Crenotrichaceae bacterium]|nr:hypothetical protein [Crenotrichaceae bacterium]
MKRNRNHQQLFILLLTGCFIASLIYLFHPETGQFSVVLNGEPVADPFIQLAVIPAMLAVLFLTGIVMILSFLGVGLVMFLGALLFMMFSIFLIAPFSWPLLLFIFLMIAIISSGGNSINRL